MAGFAQSIHRFMIQQKWISASRYDLDGSHDLKGLLNRGVIEKEMSTFVAFVDGAALGNPGPAGIGVVVEGFQGFGIRIAKSIGHQDNNVAEYMALLEALQCALEFNATALHVYSDSEVVVKQMIGQYNCRSLRLYSLHWACRKVARSLDFSISHIRREHNEEANRLARSASLKRWLTIGAKDTSETLVLASREVATTSPSVLPGIRS